MAPSTLQTLAQPSNLHHGLASLPTEIFIHIRICLRELDEPYHDEPDMFNFAPNTSFPLVCRRFRNLELSIPSLWTLLRDDMTSDRISLHNTRSGALGLRIHLIGHNYEKWRLMAQSSHRWSILEITAYNKQQHNCLPILRGLSLPSLWKLRIFGFDDAVIPILSTWSIPSVRVLNSHRQSALLALPLTQPLTTLILDHCFAKADADGLLDFLESAKASQLTYLGLGLNRFNVQGGSPMRYKKVTLPMLQDLSLQCLNANDRVPDHMIFQLMRCITMPNIQSVTIELSKDVDIDDTFINWIGSLKNPSLRTVSVKVIGDLEDSDQRRIVNAFQENGGGLFQVESSDGSYRPQMKITFT